MALFTGTREGIPAFVACLEHRTNTGSAFIKKTLSHLESIGSFRAQSVEFARSGKSHNSLIRPERRDTRNTVVTAMPSWNTFTTGLKVLLVVLVLCTPLEGTEIIMFQSEMAAETANVPGHASLVLEEEDFDTAQLMGPEDSPQVVEQPVIEGILRTGFTPMVVDSSQITSHSRRLGCETWLMIAQAVQQGTKLFGHFQAEQGEVCMAVDAQSWKGKFPYLAVREVPSAKLPWLKQMSLRRITADGFMVSLKAQRPELKLLVVDNLVGYLPNAPKGASALAADIQALNDAAVNHGLAVVGIVDVAEADGKKLRADMKQAIKQLCIPTLTVKAQTALANKLKFRVFSKATPGIHQLENVNGSWRRIAASPAPVQAQAADGSDNAVAVN